MLKCYLASLLHLKRGGVINVETVLIIVLTLFLAQASLSAEETDNVLSTGKEMDQTFNNLLVPKEFLNLLFRDCNQCFVFLVELQTQTAFLIDFQKEPYALSIIREFEISSGKQKGAKRSELDLRTPLGFYEIAQYRASKTLEKKFGPGAYVLNYPNHLDRIEKKTGSGIWIHGNDRINFIDYDSEGCIRLKNDELPLLQDYLTPRTSPVIIVQKIEWLDLDNLLTMKNEFQERHDGWLSSWQNNNLEEYLSYYHPSFYNPDNNLDITRWSLHKRDISINNPPLFISINDLLIIYTENKIVVRGEQHYRTTTFSDVGMKRVLWHDTDEGWFIVREDWQPG